MRFRFVRCNSALVSTLITISLVYATGVFAQNDSNRPRVPPDINHGRALYDTACDKCHSQNIHWRDRRQATSWATLLNEVTRWQRNAGQRWEQADIKDVAAYLNERFYHFPCPDNECVEKEAAAQPGQ